MEIGIVIDCDECVVQHTSNCQDCVVTFLCGRDTGDTGDAVVVDVDELRTMRRLADAGLAPRLRHRRSG